MAGMEVLLDIRYNFHYPKNAQPWYYDRVGSNSVIDPQWLPNSSGYFVSTFIHHIMHASNACRF